MHMNESTYRIYNKKYNFKFIVCCLFVQANF